MKLHDRINRVINTEAFEKTLLEKGKYLFEFQCDWPNYATFEELPEEYRIAILAGEAELSGSGTLTLA
ncbi:MAG: hypothetical protein LV479_06135 [Methylacidiphilales bacterium]|nr:hypothetical protein [Candidatus Methylacidiphilales bacterium]